MAVSLRGRRGGSSNASIPTASTGDIAFLILIFFMSTSMFAKEKGLKIVLPEPTPPGEESAVKIPPENLLHVDVDPQGQVQVSLASEPEKAELVSSRSFASYWSVGSPPTRRATRRRPRRS